MSKLEEGMFFFTPDSRIDYSIHTIIRSLLSQKDFDSFIRENLGKEMVVSIKPKIKVAEKQLMYAYYHRVILQCAVVGWTAMGEENMNGAIADYKLKSYCAVSTFINKDNEEEMYLEDKAKMSKDRLTRYLSDCIHFIESKLQTRVPDSQEYKDKVNARNRKK